jgi:hypothetical protein
LKSSLFELFLSYVVLHHQTSSSPHLAGTSYCCAAISLFSRPAHLLTAPQYLCLAGASSSLRRHLFSWLAHCHAALSYLAGVAVRPYHILAGASNRCATIACLGWRIRSPILAGASHRRANLSYFSRRIQSLRHYCLSWLAHPIAYFGRRISLPQHHCLSWLAHPIAYLGRRTPSSRRHPLSWLVHPLAAPPFLSLPAYYCCTTIAYRLSWLVHPIALPPYRIFVGISHPVPPILSWRRIPSPRHNL